MYSYMVCSLFFLVFVSLLYGIGKYIAGGDDFSDSLLSGYIIYSIPVAIFGIAVQLCNLPWLSFAILLGIEWAVLIIIAVKKAKVYEEKIIRQPFEVREFFKKNWVVLATTVCMVIVMLLYYKGFWLCNHQDDGFYITKVATLPFTQTGGDFNYAVGVENSSFSTYLLNTWEIEASVYVRLMHVDVTLFLRLFQSAFYYFLLANLVRAFAKKVMCCAGVESYESLAQYPAVIILLFNVYYIALSSTGLLNIQDMFHMNTGMFLGFSIVRALGLLLLFVFFIDWEQVDPKMVVGVALIAVVLISKSTVALPLIIVAALSALICWRFPSKEKKTWLVPAGCGLLVVAAGAVLPGSDGIQESVLLNYRTSFHSPVIWACLVVFLLSFTLKIPVVNRMNRILVGMILLTVLPEVNDIVETVSVYNFVGARTVSAIVFMFVMTNAVYFVLLLYRFQVKEKAIKLIYLVGGVGLLGICLLGFKLYGGQVIPGTERAGGSFRHSIRTICENPYLMPKSTIELGQKLDELSEETQEHLNVVMPAMVYVDDALHPLAVMVRTYAPDITSVSAAPRFRVKNGSALSDYWQAAYDPFVSEPSDETYEAFREEISELDVNCIVVQDERCTPWLEQDGFELSDTVGNEMYYIWCRK